MQRAVFWLIKTQEAVTQKHGTPGKTRCLLSLFFDTWTVLIQVVNSYKFFLKLHI